MSQKSDLHPISLQYQVRTSKQGYRELERLLPLLGKLQNAAIRHRRLMGKAGVPHKEILRLQNAGITDLREHDPDFANISRRLAESVVKRVNDSYHRAFTVPSAGFPKTDSPLPIQDTGNLRTQRAPRPVPQIECSRDPHQGIVSPVVQDGSPDQRSGTAQGHQDHPAQQGPDHYAGVRVSQLPAFTNNVPALRD